MSAAIFGTDVTLEVKISGSYIAIGCATNCSFRFNNEIILKTDVNAGLFRKKKARISDCSAGVSGLTTLVIDTTASSLYFLQEGVRRIEQDLRFTFIDLDGVSKQIQGFFIVENIEVNGSASDFSETDIEFQGTGGFAISTIDDESGEGIIPGDIKWDWWETVEGEFAISGPGHYGRSFTGLDVIEVDREGTQYDINNVVSLSRKCVYDGTTIDFGADNPFNDGTRIYVIWQEAP
jgi:hypothetical protein